MSKTQGKNTRNRPSVAPSPRRAPNPRTPVAPVGMPRKAADNDGEAPPAEQPVDAASTAGSQSDGQGGGGNQP